MTSERDQARELRSAIDRFIHHLGSDQEYAKRYRDDPTGVLLAEGLPPDAVIQILQENGYVGDDVAGFAMSYPSLAPSLTHGFGGGRQYDGTVCGNTSCGETRSIA